MINLAAGDYGRFMAGYCSNLPSSFRLVYAPHEPRWQVWQLFLKLSRRRERGERGSRRGKRIEIKKGISCHTCHTFSVFCLGKPLRAIATCYLTCHEIAAAVEVACAELAAMEGRLIFWLRPHRIQESK